MTCTTPKKFQRPYSTLTPCEKLSVIEDALMALASGQTKVQVRQGDNWVEYGAGSIAMLERERAQLRILCNGRAAITMGRSADWPGEGC